MATPTLVASYEVLGGATVLSLTTPSFTPANGEVIIVKAATESFEKPSITGVSGGGLTYTSHAHISDPANCVVRLWSTVVSGSPGSMSITTTFDINDGYHSMVVERWSNATLAASPAVLSTIATSAPSVTLATAANGSVISWVCADWNANAPGTPTYRSDAVQTGMHDQSTSFYVAYYAYQNTGTAGNQTVGMSSPGNQEASMAGIEIQGAGPQVVVDRVGPSSAGAAIANNTALSWSHTCTGNERLLIVGLSVGFGTTLTVAGVTYNSVSMTSAGRVQSNNQNDGYVELFYLVNPTVGTNTVQVTADSAKDLIGGSVSFIGVDQTTPVSNTATAFGSSAAPSVNVSSAAGNIVIDVVGVGSAITSSDQTLRWLNNLNGSSGSGNAAQSTAAGASSVTMSYVSASDWWGIVGTSVNAAGAQAVVTTQAVTNINSTTATGNGTVVSDGGSTITERGVCWNTSPNPTTANSKASTSGTTGVFSVSMTGLSSTTLYYVRAYAINANGTVYGDNVTFIHYSATLSWLTA